MAITISVGNCILSFKPSYEIEKQSVGVGMTFASALNGRRRPLQAGSAFIILRWAKVKAAQSGSPSMPGIGLKTN